VSTGICNWGVKDSTNSLVCHCYQGMARACTIQGAGSCDNPGIGNCGYQLCAGTDWEPACHPVSDFCGVAGEPCCNNQLCSNNTTCVAGTCQSCGAQSQPCCGDAHLCAQGITCNANGTCGCGALGQTCCASGTACTAGTCINGTCQLCGQAGQVCCPSDPPCHSQCPPRIVCEELVCSGGICRSCPGGSCGPSPVSNPL
jgi:hypothetical protein